MSGFISALIKQRRDAKKAGPDTSGRLKEIIDIVRKYNYDDGITPEIVVGIIDLGDIQDTVLTYPINLPADVTNLSGVTSVEISVKFVGVSTATVSVRNFNIINVPEGMRVVLNTKYLDIVVRGPASSMQKLDAEDIIVTIDFAGKEPASMESYPVTITFNSERKDVGEVGTYQIWATLEPIPAEEADEG